AHKVAVRWLMETIERQPSASRLDALRKTPLRDETTRQPFERAGKLTPVRFALEKLPVIERRAIAQAEAGHKVVPIAHDGGCERLDAAPTDLIGRMPMCLARGEVGLELVHIEAQLWAWSQLDTLAVNGKAGVAQRLVECRERPPQGCARVRLIVVRPEE